MITIRNPRNRIDFGRESKRSAGSCLGSHSSEIQFERGDILNTAKEVKLTFTCDIVTFHQDCIHDMGLLESLILELNAKLLHLALTANHELRLEGVIG